jgi:hypothetical protein
VFPFHTLTFALWLVVVDPHFITGDSVTQKDVTFFMIPVQKSVTDVQMVMPMLFHELFWNPSCTKFTEVKSVVGDFIGRILTNLQLVCHVINSHHCIVRN